MKEKHLAGWLKTQVLRDCKKDGKKCGNMQMCPPAGLQARRRTATEPPIHSALFWANFN